MVKYYSLLSLVLVSVAAADRKAIINLRQLQGATRPPKTPPPTAAATRPPKTPPPTPAATRPPKTPAPTPSPTIAGPQSIAQIVCSTTDYSTLCNYLKSAGLYEILDSSGTYTLFAPNNDAFDELASVADLTNDEIMGLLMYHVAPIIHTYNNLMTIDSVDTMVPALPIAVSTGADGEVLLNGKVTIVTPDIDASNGIIQGVNHVIIPPIDPPTPAPFTPEPTLKPTETITPEPTLKPTEVNTPEQTLKPTEVKNTPEPTLKPTEVNTPEPTLEPSTKPPTTNIVSESPTQFPTPFPYGKGTPSPTINSSIIDIIGTSSPTREKSSVFSTKSAKSGSKTPKADPVVGKSSKHSSKSSKSSSSKSNKSDKVVGKADKGSGSGRPGYYAIRDVSATTINTVPFMNARFRADLNASSQLGISSGYVTVAVLTAAAWFWHN
mmetsp:Transcript_23908/g.47461  ORF Transcript_23908/g.47461 Transcript_23908/m.47461 type:complete len:437 (+) Transcript_23908:35-1345(+)